MTNGLVNLLTKLGERISKAAKDRNMALLLIILSIFSPIGFIIAASLIAHAYKGRKGRVRRQKR